MNPAEQYFNDIHAIRSTGGGVAETSYYPALSKLLDSVGAELSPKVRCVNQVKNTGAGNPDFGLYSEAQYSRSKGSISVEPTQLPERGVIEVKKFKDDSWVTAEGDQVSRYWKHYGQVLVTNYRDFELIGKDDDGAFKKLEPLRLAKSAEDFWEQCAHPRAFADKVGDRLVGYLRRVILYQAPLVDPATVAWLLASYAKEARFRIEASPHLSGLERVRESLEGALGLSFASSTSSPKEREKGEHFFRATLVQTLFYGVFSSWVLWSKGQAGKTKRFNWHEAAWNLHVPMINALFNQIATPSQLKPLELDEVMDWAAEALNRVDRQAFFSRFEDDHAVQYFYEPFLEAYDPELRKDLGVWYTPPEIVRYQVERVDWALRNELGIVDGLADPKVHVLDPACGTGAYLVEVLRKISETLKAKGNGTLIPEKLKRAAMDRLHGFEILPAPYVVSHLQLGLLLSAHGAPLDQKGPEERVGVFLTNSLTGWEKSPKKWAGLPLLELSEERDAASKVKQESPILVIIGNPPYNAFAGTSPEEEEGLVEPYKEKLNLSPEKGGWGVKKFNLDDLYVRFIRIAERRIVLSGQGIISYISPSSYLSEPSFVVMRQRLLKEFDKLYFDNMNGDSRETGKLTPEGKPDPSVFSTERNKEGIRVGTAICLLVRHSKRSTKPETSLREFWGVSKRADLLASVDKKGQTKGYEKTDPTKDNRFTFFPEKTSSEYLAWPKVTDLCAESPSNGLMEKRGGALFDLDKNLLEKRMRAYFDSDFSWEKYKSFDYGLTQPQAGFDPQKARQRALKEGTFQNERIVRYLLRPFETRYCYYTEINPIWNRARPKLWAQLWKGNSFFVTRLRTSSSTEGFPATYTSLLSDDHLLAPDASCFPVMLKQADGEAKGQVDLLAGRSKPLQANLSEKARNYLESVNFKDFDNNFDSAALIWRHSLAVCYSKNYLEENDDGVRSDWPRIPMPKTGAQLKASANLGEDLSRWLDCDAQIPGLNVGKTLRPELMVLGVPTVAENKRLDAKKHFEVTAGWGHEGKEGVVMPAKGKVEYRAYTLDEKAAFEKGAKALGISVAKIMDLLGKRAVDVYLNKECYWSCVPENVWEFTVGGYQVIKKWLSYRESELLGRPLHGDEVEHVMDVTRRLAAILLLQPALDENYKISKKDAYSWKAS